MGALLTFEHVMELILHEFIKGFFKIYLDDGMIYMPMEKHVDHLELILNTCHRKLKQRQS